MHSKMASILDNRKLRDFWSRVVWAALQRMPHMMLRVKVSVLSNALDLQLQCISWYCEDGDKSWGDKTKYMMEAALRWRWASHHLSCHQLKAPASQKTQIGKPYWHHPSPLATSRRNLAWLLCMTRLLPWALRLHLWLQPATSLIWKSMHSSARWSPKWSRYRIYQRARAFLEMCS